MSKRRTPFMIACLAAITALGSSGCSTTRPRTPRPQAAAEAPQISPNRPTFSDGTALVPSEHLQLETGWTFTRRQQAGTNSERHNLPELVARYRVFDSLEARVLWGGQAWTRTEAGGMTTRADGGTDPALAILVPVVEQTGWRPALVLEAATTLGVGDETLTSGHADPAYKLLWSYSGGHLPDWFGIGGNLVVAYPTEHGDRFNQTAASVYATVSPTGSDTSVFAEWYVVSPYANDLSSAHTADAGIVQRLSRTTAVDARVGFGLDHDADDFFTGIGFSVLF